MVLIFSLLLSIIFSNCFPLCFNFLYQRYVQKVNFSLGNLDGKLIDLFNANLGGLFKDSFVVGVVTLPPVKNLLEFCQKLEVRCVSTNTYLISENIPLSTRTPSILLISIFFWQKFSIFGKSSASNQSNSMRAVLEIFSSI